MLGLLDREPLALSEPAPEGENPAAAPESPETGEYEIVLGRRQMASLMFVGVVAVVLFSGVAYLAGKGSVPKPQSTKTEAKAAPAPVVTPAPSMPSASIVVPPKPLEAMVQAKTAAPSPIFGEPETGKVYLQIGAVERGMAVILCEGLRAHGFDSFVAPGPSEKIYRVLIGPLKDPAAYNQAKAAVDAIDLATFARKYQK
jgi:cell division septation protein DedD